MKRPILTLILLCSTAAWAAPTLKACEQKLVEGSWESLAGYGSCINYLSGMVEVDRIHRLKGAKANYRVPAL